MFTDETKARASWIIGRAEDCDLVVPELTVGSHHCRLTSVGTGYVVEDLNSRNGTFINGVKIPPGTQVPVPPGAKVILGGEAEMPWPSVSKISRSETIFAPVESFAAPKAITIGRNPQSDIPIDLPTVSWDHARITLENGRYFLEDLGSMNGTAIGVLNNRIQRAELDPSSFVFLGSYKVAAARLLPQGRKIEIGESARQSVEFPPGKTVVEIGRDPQCDVPLDFPMVSWRHARLTRAAEGILVEDLGSRNGTFVDGIHVAGKVLVKPGQEIGLGSFRFQLQQSGQLIVSKYYGNVTIEAKDIVVNAGKSGLCLLNPTSLTVFPSELVAVMGPAGAGKTTLLKALNGYTRPAQGTVLFNGVDLYRYYDRFRQQMGYVPQDDIVHPQLTVREAVYFSARLRTDLTDSEIEARTIKILQELDIGDKINTVIGSPESKTLSGGQRKRVNIALELIADTPVLFLDEPTSGLSSYDAESVIDLLKNLAKGGKTVITTIHQPSLKIFKQFDDLIMICRDKSRKGEPSKAGEMVYFGPAHPDSVQFFNPQVPGATRVGGIRELNPEMLEPGMNAVPEGDRTATWRQRYLESRYSADFVASRSGQQAPRPGNGSEENARRQFGLKQWFALVRRNATVKLRDRGQAIILLAQAPLFAVLVCVIASPLDTNDFAGLTKKLAIAHFLMVVAAIWFGCNNAARDIVGEWTIYRRERMVTLKLLPYVFSKFAVLFALCIFQCGSMLGIVYLYCGYHSNFLREFLVLLLSSMIGASLGLFISASSRTNERAVALLPVVLLPVIALAGGIRPIHEMPKVGDIVSSVIPSRWAFEANLLEEAAAKEWMPGTPSGSQSAMQGTGTVPNAPGITYGPQNLPADIAEPILPLNYRHEYRDYMAILGIMLVTLFTGVILMLLKRDRDPQ